MEKSRQGVGDFLLNMFVSVVGKIGQSTKWAKVKVKGRKIVAYEIVCFSSSWPLERKWSNLTWFVFQKAISSCDVISWIINDSGAESD